MTKPLPRAMKVVNLVSRLTSTSPELILSGCRSRHVITVRHAVCWLLHHELGLSVTEIGRNISKDHSTVCHALERAKTNSDWRFREIIKHAQPVVREMAASKRNGGEIVHVAKPSPPKKRGRPPSPIINMHEKLLPSANGPEMGFSDEWFTLNEDRAQAAMKLARIEYPSLEIRRVGM